MRRTPERMRALAIVVFAGVFLLPIYWLVVTSLKSEAENIAWPPTFWPQECTLENYREVVSHPEDTPVFSWFRNSLVAAASYSVLSVAIALLAGYALARMEFAGKRLYLILLLIGMAVPAIVLLIPSFIVVDALGWTDTLKAIIFPHLGNTFAILLIAQYLKKLPRDVEDAARIDGASSLKILIHIVVPFTKPVLVTLLVLNFMANWNDYFWPFITLYSPDMRTMPVGMATLQGRFFHFYGSMMAGAVLMALPSILLFILVQRYYIRAIGLSGALKE
jgi:multiple sugar transport system permease protein